MNFLCNLSIHAYNKNEIVYSEHFSDVHNDYSIKITRIRQCKNCGDLDSKILIWEVYCPIPMRDKLRKIYNID